MKFEIGDIVFHIAALKDNRFGVRPKAGIVVEQNTQICPGGTQHNYKISFCNGYREVNEIELVGEDHPMVAECAALSAKSYLDGQNLQTKEWKEILKTMESKLKQYETKDGGSTPYDQALAKLTKEDRAVLLI